MRTGFTSPTFSSQPSARVPLRILMLTGEYPPRPGGVSDYTARLASALKEIGNDVQVLTTASTDQSDLLQIPASRLVRDWGIRAWPLIESALERAGAHILHIQYQPGAFQLKGAVNLLPLWLRRRRPEVRTITTFHDLRVPYLFPKAGPLRPLFVRLLVTGSHGAIFVDPSDRERVGPGRHRRWLPIASNIPCNPPLDFDRAATRRALGVQPDTLLIGYFGFLTASKGADDLLRSLRLLLDQNRPAHLALIGAPAGGSSVTDQADAAEARALAARLNLEQHITRTGYLDPRQVSAHLLACDLIALPFDDGASFRRGSLLAAMEHGLPIVTTRPCPAARGTEPRRLQPDRQFLSVPPNDPPALTNALARLADDPALASRLGAEARTLAAHCSWNAIAAETAQLYADVLSRT